MSRVVHTIGHGNRSLDEFTGLLQRSAIACLVDVRAFPGSRRHPHFGRGELERSLTNCHKLYPDHPVQRIFGLGGGFQMHGLLRHLRFGR